MVNKGRIYGEIRNFLTYSSKLIKSDNELMIKIGENAIMKDNFKLIPRNQESLNLDLISWRNRRLKWRENFRRRNHDFD